MGSKPRLLKNYFNEGITKKRKSTTTERKKLQSCIQEKTKNSEWQREWENNTNKLHNIKLRTEDGNVPTTAVSNTRLN